MKKSYKLIDLLKFLSAYLVIGIHTRPFLVVSPVLDRMFYYDISNYAVPFFYACTGYFLIAKQPEKDLQLKLVYRIKKVFKLYLLWSVAYLPLTIYGWIIEGNLSFKYMLVCIQKYILVGENFYSWALWYLNGLIFALMLIYILNRRFSFEFIIRFGMISYLLGIVLNILGKNQDKLSGIIIFLVKAYYHIFITTRNGLFQSLVFISIGMCVAQKEKLGNLFSVLDKWVVVLSLYVVKIPISLISGEEYLGQIFDLPIFCFIFVLIIYGCQKINLQSGIYAILRVMSGTIYFVHMYFVAFCDLILHKEGNHNFESFLISAMGATFVAWFHYYGKLSHVGIKKSIERVIRKINIMKDIMN